MNPSHRTSTVDGVDGEGRFREIYLALVALTWQAMERVDRLLPDHGGMWATPVTEGHLQWLRLELLQLGGSAVRCGDSRFLPEWQQRLVQELASAMLDWLDFDTTMPTQLVRLRLAAAQNWLLEEASRWKQEGAAAEPDRMRG